MTETQWKDARARNGYAIVHTVEHCHRCHELTNCVVRWNFIRLGNACRKTALCKSCAVKEQDSAK